MRPHHYYYWRVADRPRRARWEAAAKWPRRPRQGGALPSLRQGYSQRSSDLTLVEPINGQSESFRCVHLSFCEWVRIILIQPKKKKRFCFVYTGSWKCQTPRFRNIEHKRKWRHQTWNGLNHRLYLNLLLFSNQMFTAPCRLLSTRKASSTNSSGS